MSHGVTQGRDAKTRGLWLILCDMMPEIAVPILRQGTAPVNLFMYTIILLVPCPYLCVPLKIPNARILS